jgi:hypothetical protein
LPRWCGSTARAPGAITGITLVAGFASTVGWPLTAWMEATWDWRGACAGWAALHLLLGLPLNAWLPRPACALRPPCAPDLATPPEAPVPHARRTALLLSFVFAATWFTSTAMAAHLPACCRPRACAASGRGGRRAGGAGPGGGAAAGVWPAAPHAPAGIGPAGSAGPPHGCAAPGLGRWCRQCGSSLLHGAGNGILTIAKGTLPLVLFGSLGYGRARAC